MLGAYDRAIFHFINSTLSNPLFDMAMPLVTRLGSGEFIFIMAIFIVLLSAPQKRLSGILLLAGLTACYFAAGFIKDSVALPRPFISMSDVRLLIAGQSGFSFPSAHACNVFMAAAILTRFFNKDWLWYLLATLVAFSRVYIGVHYPSDVLVGALLGMMIGYILLKIADKPKVS